MPRLGRVDSFFGAAKILGMKTSSQIKLLLSFLSLSLISTPLLAGDSFVDQLGEEKSEVVKPDLEKEHLKGIINEALSSGHHLLIGALLRDAVTGKKTLEILKEIYKSGSYIQDTSGNPIRHFPDGSSDRHSSWVVMGALEITLFLDKSPLDAEMVAQIQLFGLEAIKENASEVKSMPYSTDVRQTRQGYLLERITTILSRTLLHDRSENSLSKCLEAGDLLRNIREMTISGYGLKKRVREIHTNSQWLSDERQFAQDMSSRRFGESGTLFQRKPIEADNYTHGAISRAIKAGIYNLQRHYGALPHIR